MTDATPFDPVTPGQRQPDPDERRHQLAGELTRRLRLAVDANTDYLAATGLTAAQVAAQVRLLTRQVNGIVRLMLADELLDASDD